VHTVFFENGRDSMADATAKAAQTMDGSVRVGVGNRIAVSRRNSLSCHRNEENY